MRSRQIGMTLITSFSTYETQRQSMESISNYTEKVNCFCSAKDSFRFQENLSSGKYWNNDAYHYTTEYSILAFTVVPSSWNTLSPGSNYSQIMGESNHILSLHLGGSFSAYSTHSPLGLVCLLLRYSSRCQRVREIERGPAEEKNSSRIRVGYTARDDKEKLRHHILFIAVDKMLMLMISIHTSKMSLRVLRGKSYSCFCCSSE